jgi:uncharacterized membrane protein
VRLRAPALALLFVVAALTGCGGGSDDGPSGEASAPATLEEIHHIAAQRCVPCHSPNPTIAGYEQAGLPDFTDPANLEANKEAIYQVVVVEKRMPFNDNVTKMTQEERDRVASWAKPSG